MHQTIVTGHLGAAPEMRYTESGVAVANFNVATTEKWKDASGNKQERTTWYTVTAWRKQAELVSTYLTKGSQVLVMGKMKEARAWVGEDGQPRARLELTLDNITFLGGGERNGNGNGPSANTGRNAPPVDEPMDDDIPF